MRQDNDWHGTGWEKPCSSILHCNEMVAQVAVGLQTPERTASQLVLGCYSNQSLNFHSKVVTPPRAGISGLDGGFHIPQSCSLFSNRAASKPGQPEQQHFPQLLPLNE